jgi:hypothetical protein
MKLKFAFGNSAPANWTTRKENQGIVIRPKGGIWSGRGDLDQSALEAIRVVISESAASVVPRTAIPVAGASGRERRFAASEAISREADMAAESRRSLRPRS